MVQKEASSAPYWVFLPHNVHWATREASDLTGSARSEEPASRQLCEAVCLSGRADPDSGGSVSAGSLARVLKTARGAHAESRGSGSLGWGLAGGMQGSVALCGTETGTQGLGPGSGGPTGCEDALRGPDARGLGYSC